MAGLGNTRVLYSKDGHSARSRVADPQPPEQGANWADLVGLALGSVGTQMGKGHLSQPAEVCLWFEREESLARRRRRPAPSLFLSSTWGVSPALPWKGGPGP